MKSSRRGFFATLAALPAVVMGRKAIAVERPAFLGGAVRWPRDAKAGEVVTLKINCGFSTRDDIVRNIAAAVDRQRTGRAS